MERRRYHIGNLRNLTADTLQAKMKKQVRFICLVCLSAWALLGLAIIPTNHIVERYPRSSSEMEGQMLTNTMDYTTNVNSGYLDILSWIRNLFPLSQKFIIQYRIAGEKYKRGNMVTKMDENNTHHAHENSDNAVGVFSPGNNRKIRIHDGDSKKQVLDNEVENKQISWSKPGKGSEQVKEETFIEAKGRKDEENIGLRLNKYLTTPTTTCTHLVRLGGRSCLGAYDGSKLVCLDKDVKPDPQNCMVYSFGVGNDFTFDNYIQDYGCEVHSFDHDNDHEVYDYRQGPRAYFHKARIGIQEGYFKTCELSQYGLECQPSLRYYTMSSIRRMLKHETTTVDYFKMDIEGAEWMVLGDVIHNSTIFSYTKQIALEIHMDELRVNSTMEESRSVLRNFMNIFQSLEELGFQVAAYEENEVKPMYVEADGVTVSIYAEVLLLKRSKKISLTSVS